MLAALRLARSEPELRVQLWNNVRFMKSRLDGAGVPTGVSASQVIPIMVRDDARIFTIGESLFRAGVFINPVKYPAVPKHRSRFRMSISAAHTHGDLDRGAQLIAGVLREYDICHP